MTAGPVGALCALCLARPAATDVDWLGVPVAACRPCAASSADRGPLSGACACGTRTRLHALVGGRRVYECARCRDDRIVVGRLELPRLSTRALVRRWKLRLERSARVAARLAALRESNRRGGLGGG